MDDKIENQDEQETKSRKPPGYWNDYDRCYEEASKYKTRGEFGTKSSRAYWVAIQNGWIDDYTWLKRRSSKSLITEDIPNSEE